jgi:hypothetical protein
MFASTLTAALSTGQRASVASGHLSSAAEVAANLQSVKATG